MAIYQIFVKHIDGHSQCLQFQTPSLQTQTLVQALALPYPLRLITGTETLAPISTLSAAAGGLFPTVTVLPCLRGGKGGFGSLLRGAASKAGQKKTNNFDACRDMSGRRLRHVNAEKKLEEWKEEEEARKLEKLAEEYLKKKGKEVRREKGKNGEVEKYMEKARIESEKCMEMVESSVRESFGLYREAKRKGIVGNGAGAKSKKLKIWRGKNTVDDSDSDDDEDEDGKGKSTVLNSENCNVVNNEEGTSKAGSVNSNSDEESSGKHSEQSNLEEITGTSAEECSSGNVSENCTVEADEKLQFGSVNGESNIESNVIEEAEMTKEAAEPSIVSLVEEVPQMEVVQTSLESPVGPEVINQPADEKADVSNLDEPLDFEKYNSAKELEALGLERLKTELQRRGLKCGGTLPERAARLFLLKTTPFDKLPKKVLAAKK